MKRLSRPIRVLEKGLTRANKVVLTGMMIVMTSLVFANVVTRYVFGFSLNWSEEVARYLMIWVTYLGAGLAMRGGQHVAIEFVQERFPRRLQPWVRGFVAASVLGFLAVLTVVGIQFSDFAWRQRSPVMQWPMGAVYLAIPIGSLLFALQFLAILKEWTLATPGFEEPDASPGGGDRRELEGAA